MKKQLFAYLLCWLIPLMGWGQQVAHYKLHSHNDYHQPVPFWTAFASKCASIEVDLILHEGQLMVAHERETIMQERTLESAYLLPIRQSVQLGLDPRHRYQLLIDIKTEAYSTLEELRKVLSKYEDVLVSADNPTGVEVVISGNRPRPNDYPDYPFYVKFDHQDTDFSKALPWEKIALVSLDFKRFSTWNGKGRMVEGERQAIHQLVEKVHAANRPIRFWAAPDSKTAWKAFYDMGIDYINTDMPFQANQYLKELPRNIYKAAHHHQVYQPNYLQDGKVGPVRHIILMLGDGNGLAQISAGMFANGNKLNITKLKHMGLVKTQSADDFTTDSAAGASALATGQKTNNRGVGTLPDGSPAANLAEVLKDYGFSSGIITTDHVTGASPAAFYAHRKDRDMIAGIASDLSKSQLDLFIGGGKNDFLRYGTNQLDKLDQAGFELLRSLGDLAVTKAERVGYFASNHGLPTVSNGREGFLVKSVQKGLGFMHDKDKPFFMMVEGAMIDVGGHWNSAETVVREGLDFDQAIGEVLKFADENPGTLVLVTADHETGGVTLPQGNIKDGVVELEFSTYDHTAIMVPIFAYGPHADEFMGVYENTAVFDKIIKLVKRYYNRVNCFTDQSENLGKLIEKTRPR